MTSAVPLIAARKQNVAGHDWELEGQSHQQEIEEVKMFARENGTQMDTVCKFRLAGSKKG